MSYIMADAIWTQSVCFLPRQGEGLS
jgi:hypothetical protein